MKNSNHFSPILVTEFFLVCFPVQGTVYLSFFFSIPNKLISMPVMLLSVTKVLNQIFDSRGADRSRFMNIVILLSFLERTSS